MSHSTPRLAPARSPCRRPRHNVARAESLEPRTLFALPTVEVAMPTSVLASETGPQDNYFILTRTGGDISKPLTVNFSLSGSATAGADYEPIGDHVTIPAGATFINIPVRVIPDSVPEMSEVVTLNLLASPNYAFGFRRGASVIIRDDYRVIREYGEPNEDWREPTPWGDNPADGPRLALMAIDKGDIDMFRVHSRPDGTPLEVMIEFDHRLGDLNMALLNDVGTRELARSTGAGDVERVVLPPTPGETYLVKVWGQNGATNPMYSLDVRPIPAGPTFHMVSPSYSFDYNEVLFPVVKPGEPAQATATIMNAGAQPLELGPMNVPAGFQLIKAAKSTLAPGESDTVTFAWPGSDTPGVYNADVTFGTNESAGATRSLHLVNYVSGVVSRQFLYNNSAADRNTAQFTRSDPAAADPDKRALLPGQTPSAENVSNYSKGINGVLLTMVRADYQALSPDDFELRYAGPDGKTWTAAPESVNVLSSYADWNTSHVSLIWPDYVAGSATHIGQALANGWLEVTMKANAHTGLTAPDVSYYGNLIGDTGDTPNGQTPEVNALDLAAVAAHRARSGGDWRYDFNRDGAVNALDLGIARANLNRRLSPMPETAAAAVLFSTTPVPSAARADLAELLR